VAVAPLGVLARLTVLQAIRKRWTVRWETWSPELRGENGRPTWQSCRAFDRHFMKAAVPGPLQIRFFPRPLRI